MAHDSAPTAADTARILEWLDGWGDTEADTLAGRSAAAIIRAQDAEIARLREALTALAGGGVRVRRQWFRDHGMPEVADRRQAYADALARAALAPPDPPDGGGEK